MDVLIKNAVIITQNKKHEIIKGDLFIRKNKIEKIGKNLNEKVEEKIDAEGMLVLPGFVNTHTHVATTLFRGYGEDLALKEWLVKKIWPIEKKLTSKDVYWGAMLGIAEMIRSGTTTFNEMYVTGLEKIVQAVEKSGIRASIALGMLDKINGSITSCADEEIKKTKKFIKSIKNERILPAVSCHAPYTCTEELIKKAKEYAKKNNLQFHIHISETRKEVFDIIKEKKKRPFEYLNDLKVLDKKSVLAHAVYVSKKEIALAGKTNISHNPISNLKLAGGGVSPILEFAKQGTTVALGTDGAASNNSLNMIETMKIAAILQKNHYWNPTAPTAQQILDFATINGAKALGINAGCIEKGALADIITVDLKSVNMCPYHDYYSNIVYAMNPSNIVDVIINGEIVMRKRKIICFDEGKVIEKVGEIAKDIIAR